MVAPWSLPAVHDVLAAAYPDRHNLVGTSVRRTFAEVGDRTHGLAGFLSSRGLGVQSERDELERWECGQHTVALVMRNCPEYIEAMLGCYRARVVPFNVNHHYTPAEVGALFDMVDPTAVIYERSLGPLVEQSGHEFDVFVDVDDESGVAPLAGSTNFEDAVATEVDTLPAPSPDDLYMVCTGGTTGLPKAVLWRQADIFDAAMNGHGLDTAEAIVAGAQNGGAAFPTAPLMHAAAQWTVFAGMHGGATSVLHDVGDSFDAAAILTVAEQEKVTLMSIVGDAFARPISAELERGDYDLSNLVVLATGGAFTSDRYKDAILEQLPHVIIVDGYGASETGGMAFGAKTKDGSAVHLAPGSGAFVISADRTRPLEPGTDEVGWTARAGAVPLGYLNDREATEHTFPIIDGQRVSVPGDRARLDAEGRIELLGRDGMVVNSGGEKVYVEEVELALRADDRVADALVVGRPSERFGQEVVAIVQLADGEMLSPSQIREIAAGSLARFKAPRAVLVCDQVKRLVNGKADYTWARSIAADAVDATTQGANG